ncbi:MAG: DUF2281 domain-containing protein [Desulfobacteraceae bacterium]
MEATQALDKKVLQKFRELPDDRKMQVLDFIEFLARKNREPQSEGDAYAASLETLRLKIREKGGLFVGKSKDQLIEELRATRESLWDEDYAGHFGQQ